MQTTWILYPMLAMFILTLVVALRMLQLRLRAVYQDDLNPVYFKLNRGGKPPDYMTKVEQHYINLFESPILFYVILLLVYVTQIVDLVSLVLAWGFVAARLGHAYVHVGRNNVLQRRNVFLLSILFLVSLWLYSFIKLSIT